jgi:RimJ/RimL family protein N-acetyltransferase
MASLTTLRTILKAGDTCLEPLAEAHREPLRAACPEDDPVWDIYPFKMAGDQFDPLFDRALADANWVRFAALYKAVPIGFTSYLNIDAPHNTLEIGGTYFAPHIRGSGYNRQVKNLMINHALACGYTRIEFRVDARNTRSQAAVRKLGATHEGTLRKNRINWNGYVRDTMVFSLLVDEWTCG